MSSADPKYVLICAWCGRWRDPQDAAVWHPAETLTADTAAHSHGMCPDCREQLSRRKAPSAGRSPDASGDADARL